MSQAKGQFTVKNAAGTVVFTGVAATYINSNNSVGLTDNTPLELKKDSAGVPRQITKDYHEYQMDLDLTPGIGGTFASRAALLTAFRLQAKGSSFTCSGFDLTDMNWDSTLKAVVWDCSMNAAQEAHGTLRVTVKRWTDLAGTPIDFTGAWAAL